MTPALKSIVYSGTSFDPTKTILSDSISKQEFAKDGVYICQSIDPYKRIVDASKIISSGGSLFLTEQIANKRK